MRLDVDGNGVVNAQEIAAALNATAMRSEHLALSQDARWSKRWTTTRGPRARQRCQREAET